MPQPGPLLQFHFDGRIRIENALPAKQIDGVEEMAGWTDGGQNFETVLLPRIEVVGPMSWRRVHDACSRFERDVRAQHSERISMKERMPEADVLELAALQPGDDVVERASGGLGDLWCQRLCHDDGAAVDVVCRIVKLRMKRHCEIRRNRPGRGRPY